MNQKLKLSEVMTLEEAARFLRVRKKEVEELATDGKIPARQVNGQWRFLKAAVEEWLRSREIVSSRDTFLDQAGAFKDDPALDEIVRDAYRARGRTEAAIQEMFGGAPKYPAQTSPPKVYRYVGPKVIAERCQGVPAAQRVLSVADLYEWMQASGEEANSSGLIGVTFVIDQAGFLRIANRRSEHIACAGGEPVLSAGEMWLRDDGDGFEVGEVTNQSTGYCPEPESWHAVATALDSIPLPHLGRFTTDIVFRRCEQCGQRNVVKDSWFVCGACGTDLPEQWNFA
jgi:excisionase family DNA binding protein